MQQVDTGRRPAGAGLVPLLLFFLLLLAVEASTACSCKRLAADPAEEGSAFHYADAVFSATVLDAAVLGDDPGDASTRYDLEVHHVWKGHADAVDVVIAGNSGASCGLRLEVGMTYLVYAQSEAGTLTTGSCSGTIPFDRALTARLLLPEPLLSHALRPPLRLDLPALLTLLDGPPDLAATAVKALAVGGYGEELTAWLGARTLQPDGSVRGDLLFAAVRHLGPDAVLLLERFPEFLEADDPAFRRGWRSVLLHALESPALDDLVVDGLADADPDVVADAARVIHRLADPGRTAVRLEVRDRFDHSPGNVQIAIADGLAAFDDLDGAELDLVCGERYAALRVREGSASGACFDALRNNWDAIRHSAAALAFKEDSWRSATAPFCRQDPAEPSAAVHDATVTAVRARFGSGIDVERVIDWRDCAAPESSPFLPGDPEARYRTVVAEAARDRAGAVEVRFCAEGRQVDVYVVPRDGAWQVRGHRVLHRLLSRECSR